jgi:tyrosyl-tRNA synthetase
MLKWIKSLFRRKPKTGIIVLSRDYVFGDVMDEMPFEEVRALLQKPKEVDEHTFFLMAAWMRPKDSEIGKRFCEIAVDSGLFESHGEVRRKVKEGGVKWCGEKVTDHNFIPTWIRPGWGVVQKGKNNFSLVIRRVE